MPTEPSFGTFMEPGMNLYFFSSTYFNEFYFYHNISALKKLFSKIETENIQECAEITLKSEKRPKIELVNVGF